MGYCGNHRTNAVLSVMDPASHTHQNPHYANQIIPRIVDIGVPFTDGESVEADDARGDDEEEEAEEEPWYER
jgi:hypothetical protein